MFTVSDIIHLIQFYYKTATSYDTATAQVERFKLERLRGMFISDIAHKPNPYRNHRQTLKRHSGLKSPLFFANVQMLVSMKPQGSSSKPMLAGCPSSISIPKQCGKDIVNLHMPLRKLGIGTYVTGPPPGEAPKTSNPFHPIATASLSTPVFDVVHMFSERGISAVPILNEEGIVINLYETVDVITLVRLGAYQSLDLTIDEALNQRSTDFPGVVICTASDSLGTLMQLIKTRRVHRLVVVEGEEEEKRGGRKGRLLGIITLSDVLRYIVGDVGIGEGLEA
ncbi:hypothetical protein NLI96_g8770 [Meripilus lineatus]|uniref:CBS domain-containing protein n=1 Tax=Meripilus lineatus TaxID=2056292 RepID=A0AAD5YFZ2_9APHY|nr:hypothetical protein NLI96_g8770 [Physisporinus lineatus]